MLFDTSAVNGCGHTAVLIGDDSRGWTYYSSNGTDEHWGLYGKEKNQIRDFKTLQEFQEACQNGKLEGGYTYDKSVRIATTQEEDAMAHKKAYEKVTDGYDVLYNSCLDTSRDVVNAILRYRKQEVDKGGEGYDRPNGYSDFLKDKEY